MITPPSSCHAHYVNCKSTEAINLLQIEFLQKRKSFSQPAGKLAASMEFLLQSLSMTVEQGTKEIQFAVRFDYRQSPSVGND